LPLGPGGRRPIHERLRETVWKTGVGPQSGLRGPPRGGGEGASIGHFLSTKTHARSPLSIFQTVSRETVWKVLTTS
jgi:hypothetical protein